MSETPIVYIDGECCLCDRSARFVHERSNPGDFCYALLQEHPELFSFHKDTRGKEVDTVIVQVGDTIYTGGMAVLFLLSRMRQPYPWLARILRIFPKLMIEATYRIIARNRFWIWGRKACSLPQGISYRNK